jgi:hypothetical protein
MGNMAVNINRGIVLSKGNVEIDGNIVYLPLYLVEWM